MIKKMVLVSVLALTLGSCVSSKVHKELQGKYARLKKDRSKLSKDKRSLLSSKKELEQELAKVQAERKDLAARRAALEQQYKTAQQNLKDSKASYQVLEKNSNNAIASTSSKNKELQKALEEKEQALAQENKRLALLKKELEARSARIQELEDSIAAKDKEMTLLKNAISDALLDFKDKGLSVEQRNGNVYVSMENKLLFKSGSWSVGPEGKKAVSNLASVLAQNPDISILIEGHTDNVPYSGSHGVKDNWDLSTKRATAIVHVLLQNKGIDAKNLTAAGRSYFVPIATNRTKQGRAKNRRIEIILTPKLDKVSKLLNAF